MSPETVRCECHADREDVPGVGYAVYDERGYLSEVLEPLVGDRDAIKAEIRDASDPDRVAELEGCSNAIKWILVACFGYQGFSNAKFGRIECHEAINAFAREILLDAKETLEANGWRVVHGIVDSVWVTPANDGAQTPLDGLTDRISERAGVRLEYEAEYDWVAFVPRRNSSAGALTKYFGKVTGEDASKYRGIEYVVVADGKRSRDRVALAAEDVDDYDVEYYRDLLVRAAESVLSPLGWRTPRIETYLGDRRDASLESWVT